MSLVFYFVLYQMWKQGESLLYFPYFTFTLLTLLIMSLCGHKVCEQDFSERYQVETVDFVAYLREVALPHDVIVLRMDIEGAEYQVLHSVCLLKKKILYCLAHGYRGRNVIPCTM